MPYLPSQPRLLISRRTDQPRYHLRHGECIKKVWEVDPLECPRCHAEMKIISFITPSQPDVIQKILKHLGLWKERQEESRPPPKRQRPFDEERSGYTVT